MRILGYNNTEKYLSVKATICIFYTKIIDWQFYILPYMNIMKCIIYALQLVFL